MSHQVGQVTSNSLPLYPDIRIDRLNVPHPAHTSTWDAETMVRLSIDETYIERNAGGKQSHCAPLVGAAVSGTKSPEGDW